MVGILRIAFKLLVNDRAKFAALILGIAFAVFLMVQMTSLFVGILARSASTVTNIGAKMWVMDPAVNTVQNTILMPGYVLDAVRSIYGVKYAVPLYSGGALVKLRSGAYQSVTILGLDDASLYGRPELEEGKIEDISSWRFTISYIMVEPKTIRQRWVTSRPAPSAFRIPSVFLWPSGVDGKMPTKEFWISNKENRDMIRKGPLSQCHV